MLKHGIYVAENDGNWLNKYRIEMEVRETEKSYIFKLLKFDSRYAGDHINRMFEGKIRITLNKGKSRHVMRVFGDDGFTIYPFQAGFPYVFELKSEIDKKN